MKTTQSLLAALLALSAGAAQASLTVTAVQTSTGLFTSKPNVCTIDFNTAASLTSCGSSSYSAGTSAHIVSGSVAFVYAQPANDNTPYLTVDPSLGPVTISIPTGADYFGFYAGSIDSYNSVMFAGPTGSVTLSGSAINAFLTSNPANGSENAYFNIFTNDLFTSITLSSSGYAFETDNHSFGIASVPEPGSVALLGLGALALVARKRRRAA